MPTPTLNQSSLLEKLYHKRLNYKQLKTFGCACFPCLQPYQNHKISFHSKKYVFLGYSSLHKGYECLSSTGKIYVSRNIVFNELEFPYHHGFVKTHQPETVSRITLPSWLNISSNHTSLIPESPSKQVVEEILAPISSPMAESSSQHSPRDEEPVSSPRQSITPSKQEEERIQAENTLTETPRHQMMTRAQAGIFKPRNMPQNFQLFKAMMIRDLTTPTSIAEAIRIPHWKSAMEEEMSALRNNQTWKLVPHQPEMNLVGNKWVYKIKTNVDGSFQRCKARLVAKGFHQTPRIDFDQTFSLVIKTSTLRVILVLAVTNGWNIKQLDVNNAFLNGELKETVFMK